MKKRLQTILAHAGVTSRRAAVLLIEEGRVKVDGVEVRERGARFDPAEHKITVDGKPVADSGQKYYFLFNKPAGVISTVTDTHGRRKITDFFSEVGARLYPVGRLDKDTTGVIIVTNDGELANKLMHPSSRVFKEYAVIVDRRLDQVEIKALERGVDLEGKLTAPCRVKHINDPAGEHIYRMILHEGRKRQVKMMIAAVGANVISLSRDRYAGLSVGSLKEGEYRSLGKEEVEKLKKLSNTRRARR